MPPTTWLTQICPSNKQVCFHLCRANLKSPRASKCKIQNIEKQTRQEKKLKLPNVGLPFLLLLQLSLHHHPPPLPHPIPSLSCRKGGRMHLCRTLVRDQQEWRLINTFFQNPMACPIPPPTKAAGGHSNTTHLALQPNQLLGESAAILKPLNRVSVYIKG